MPSSPATTAPPAAPSSAANLLAALYLYVLAPAGLFAVALLLLVWFFRSYVICFYGACIG